MARRVYSDAQRAAAMTAIEANGGKVTAELARELEIPRKTLQRWAAGEVAAVGTRDVAQLKEKADATLAEMLESYARKAIEYSTAEVDAATAKGDMRAAKDAVVSAAVAIEKLLLLTNRPTQRLAVEDLRRRIEDDDLDPAEVLAEAEAIMRGER